MLTPSTLTAAGAVLRAAQKPFQKRSFSDIVGATHADHPETPIPSC
jgi:hypothetical protein